MKDVLVSQQFDDIYFSRRDGLAETEHVFLKANNLPKAWTDKPSFTICETGFGTGLNAIITFIEAEKHELAIDYTGIEAYPVSSEEIGFIILNGK